MQKLEVKHSILSVFILFHVSGEVHVFLLSLLHLQTTIDCGFFLWDDEAGWEGSQRSGEIDLIKTLHELEDMKRKLEDNKKKLEDTKKKNEKIQRRLECELWKKNLAIFVVVVLTWV